MRRSGPICHWRPFLVRAAALPLLALVCAAGFNGVRRRPLPWRADWSRHIETRARAAEVPLAGLPAVRRATDTGDALLLDARHPHAFRYGRIPGARSLFVEEAIERLSRMDFEADPDRPLITYCGGIACDEGLELALMLRRFGYRHVSLYAGGWNEWKASGGVLEKDP